MAAISELLDMQFSLIATMSLALSVVTEKVDISPIRSDGSHIQFHDDGCIAGPLH